MSGSKTVLAAAVAVALGIVATFFSLAGGPGFGAVTIGAWTAWPRVGGADIDPYARASIAVDGALPLGANEGVTFLARTDDSGATLDARCDYVLTGPAPPARAWTLTAYDLEGRLRPNLARRYGVSSAALLRDADGGFQIALARDARPGNWLPLGDKSRFILALRAYQLATGGAGDVFDRLALPKILRGSCS